jgi:hypothetical protein
MPTPDPDQGRPETVLGAVLYLMTAYHRSRCPRIAACIAAHLDCLAAHPHADRIIREVCAGMRDEWYGAARAAGPLGHSVH